jgi:hypothetical protein
MCEVSRACEDSRPQKCTDRRAQWFVGCALRRALCPYLRFNFGSGTASARAGILPGGPKAKFSKRCCMRQARSRWISALKSSFDAQRQDKSNELLRVSVAAAVEESIADYSLESHPGATGKDVTY